MQTFYVICVTFSSKNSSFFPPWFLFKSVKLYCLIMSAFESAVLLLLFIIIILIILIVFYSSPAEFHIFYGSEKNRLINWPQKAGFKKKMLSFKKAQEILRTKGLRWLTERRVELKMILSRLKSLKQDLRGLWDWMEVWRAQLVVKCILHEQYSTQYTAYWWSSLVPSMLP